MRRRKQCEDQRPGPVRMIDYAGEFRVHWPWNPRWLHVPRCTDLLGSIKAQLLLKQAIAAVLNIAGGSAVNYPLTLSQLVAGEYGTGGH